MKECTLCTETKELEQCPYCKNYYCKIHFSFHKGFSPCKKYFKGQVQEQEGDE